ETRMPSYPVIPLIPVSANDVAWLAGRWVGTRAGDAIEEIWSPPAANTLMGMFRWLRDGKVRFFELISLEAAGAGLVLRLKHFEPGLQGWEEKDQAVTFDLVALSDDEVVFFQHSLRKTQWMVYRRSGPDQLIAYFEPETGPHAPEDEFRYQRQPLAEPQ
ncbi:MAG: DUF6265 family protein, partial [Anaerolineales bacterium]